MSRRWQLDAHVRVRDLGGPALAYHVGSGDTHLLPSFSSTLLELLAAGEMNESWSPRDIAGNSHIADLQVSERDVETALEALEEAGLVRAVGDE